MFDISSTLSSNNIDIDTRAVKTFHRVAMLLRSIGRDVKIPALA